MITPEEIPRIDGDMTTLTAHADSLTGAAVAFADTGARIHQAWQGLAPVYSAPEAIQLLAATGPVMSTTASVGEDFETAAQALRTYAADTAAIQARLDALRLQAADLVDAMAIAPDESTTVTLDDQGAHVSAAVAAEIAAWEEAQLRCANAIRALTGAPRLPDYASGMTIVDHGGLINSTPIGPTGPFTEVYPVDLLPPISSTGHPPVVIGPGPLINVPAPPQTGVVDGPGSFVPPFGTGLLLDAATGEEPTEPAAPGPASPPDLVPDLPEPAIDNTTTFPPDDFEGTEYSADDLAGMIFRHTGSGDMHIGGSDPRPTESEIQETLKNGERTDLDGQNAVTYEGPRVRVIINRDLPWQSTSYYPGG